MLHEAALPQPTPDALSVSNALTHRLRELIESNGGLIRFDRYMQAALYEPGLGYYLNGSAKFGRDGDFITAPELSPLFGTCLAREAAGILAQTGGSILEFGGGSGALAASILNELRALQCVPASYEIIELSPALRERQRATIANLAPQSIDLMRWHTAPPLQPISGVVIANEVIDALPVRVFRCRDDAVWERVVGWDDGCFGWRDVVADDDLDAFVRAAVPRSPGGDYVSEINAGLTPWVHDLDRVLAKGVALVIDYGDARREHYHPDKRTGTLLCHFRHRAHDDPFWYPGLQDITASVDFTHVAEVASEAGFAVRGYAAQASFLLANGILEIGEQRLQQEGDAARVRVAYEMKLLTLPTEMGSRFKVMALGKQYSGDLRGFALRDERGRL